MSHLAEKIKQLQQDRTLQEMADLCGVSRNVFSYLARGDSVKLSTLRRIAEAFRLSQEKWLELLIAWIRLEIGERDFKKLDIRVQDEAVSGAILRDTDQRPEETAGRLIRKLSDAQRREVLRALERPEVLKCLAPINRVWERFNHAEESSRPAKRESRRQAKGGSRKKRK